MNNLNELLKNSLSKSKLEERYKKLNWEGSFEDFLSLAKSDARVVRNAFQRLYDMIMSYGVEEVTIFGKTILRYKFFTSDFAGKDAVYGLDEPLAELMDVVKAAADGRGPQKRVWLLHGPVGSSKSTIARLIKRGLEEYTKTDDGAIYRHEWELPENDIERDVHGDKTHVACPMRENPIKLLPKAIRSEVLRQIGIPFSTHEKGELCPFCRYYFNKYMEEFNGDLTKVLQKIKIKRYVFSEADRIGIGTFQPKDEKNQDSTELTGEGNYRLMAKYGSDADPRAFDFNGEFNVASGGILECIEMLKLDVAFLYDFLEATEGHKIKPRKFAQTDIDEVILAHTNPHEFTKLSSDQYMEAFRDRTIKIDIPYVTTLQEEVKIYKKDYPDHYVGGKHICPHTIEVAAMWAILTRLKEPVEKITLVQKMKAYSGKTLPGFTTEAIKELREKALAEQEGMTGISPRYIQDKISNAVVRDLKRNCVNPFMVMTELEEGLTHYSLINNEDTKKRYRELLSVVKEEYDNILKNEFQKAVIADESAIRTLCANYIDNIKAYTQKEKVKNPFTGEREDPDERLMRSIEEKIEISESQKDEFRQSIMNYIGALAIDGKRFDYSTNERLHRALELKVFEDQKDTIKSVTTMVSSTVDDEAQKKIDVLKQRMIDNYGYCEICATDVLRYIAGIFARGDVKEEGN